MVPIFADYVNHSQAQAVIDSGRCDVKRTVYSGYATFYQVPKCLGSKNR
jgi:hypothetical protein